MKYFYLCLLIFVFWLGRNSVNSTVLSLQKDLFQKNAQYDRLRSDYENLEKENEQIQKQNPVEQVRRPAAVLDVEVKNTNEVFIPQKKEADPENHHINNQEVEMNLHLEKVMKYVEYLNEGDSGNIIAFLKQQRAPNNTWSKHYNDEIDSTISKVPVRCEAYIADCFENSLVEDEKDEVVFCATQFSRCLSEQYQEIKPSEISDLE